MNKIEILLATYNGEKYLPEQIDSIINQDTDDWHLTISDDGSSDATVQIIDDYCRRYPQKIARAFSKTRFGNARDHFFWLMRQCDADYMLFSDQDDVWHSDKVRLFVQALRDGERENGRETPVLVFSDLNVVDQNLNIMYPSLTRLQRQSPEVQDYRYLLYQNTVTGCASGINRSLAQLAGRCVHSDQTVMHDWWLALAAARFGKMIYLDQSTIDYRQHGDNSVGAKDVRSMAYLFQKIVHPTPLRRQIMEKKRQASAFAQSYAAELTQEERDFLMSYAKKRSPWAFKFSYLKWINSAVRKAGFLARW